MKSNVDGLKIRLSSAEKIYSKFHSQEDDKEVTTSILPCERLLENALDVWRCFHLLYLFIFSTKKVLF